jgi:hypothetical protein
MRRARVISSSVKALLRVALAVIVVGAIAFALRSTEVDAELDNQVFTSKADGLRIVVPRYWRATDQPTYPGILLWMMRSEPEGRIALTAEPFTHAMWCSWPVTCRASHDGLSAKYACALRARLAGENMKLGAVQAGPKDNEAAGMTSVWFEYDDGKRFLRHAVAIAGERAVSLVLSTDSLDARSSLARPFDQTLRTLRPLTAAEAEGSDSSGSTSTSASASADAAATVAVSIDAAASASAPADASAPSPDASAARADAAIPRITPARDAGPADAGVVFSSAPAPHENPIGPCN